MNPLAALDRWYLAPAPALRLATLRVLVGLYGVVWLAGAALPFIAPAFFAPDRFAPVGPVALLDGPLEPMLAVTLWALALLLSPAFMLGWRFRITAPVFAALLVWVTAYRSSWGMIFHTENLLVMHVLVLTFAPAHHGWSLDAGAGRAPRDAPANARYGWAIRVMCVITVAAYVLAGVAKLRAMGWAWADGEVLQSQIAFDNLRKIALGDSHSPLGAWIVQFPALFPPLAWATLVLELGAPLALLGRQAAKAWVLTIWSFHVGVLATMWILFAYPLSGIGFASFFAAERLWETGAARRLPSWARPAPHGVASGFIQRSPGNRAKSASAEHRRRP